MLRFVLLLGLIACRRDPDAAPPCGAVAAKFLAIAKADLDRSGRSGGSSADDATRRAVLDQLPAMRDSLAHVCTESGWSDAVRRCLAAANDHLGFETCQQQLTEDQRRALDRSARGDTDSR